MSSAPFYDEESTRRIHEIGALRHGGLWLSANQSAVEVLWGFPLGVASHDVKSTIPRIVLRVLDRARLAGGYEWHNAIDGWKKSAIGAAKADDSPVDVGGKE